MRTTLFYNIHDIITIESDSWLPELQPFKSNTQIENPTIRVRVGTPSKHISSNGNNNHIHYNEIFGQFGFDVSIDIDKTINVVVSPILRLSPHVLYTNVIEPLLRWTFVNKGFALVHGAAIAFGDEAFIITAQTDTGKTTTLLKMLSYQRRDSDKAAFLSDDMTLVSPDGIALTYPKPMTISYHTLKAVNSDTLSFIEKVTLPFQSRIHSRSGRRVAFWIGKSHLPAATINMFIQMLIPPPKYFVNKLVPQAKFAKKGKLKGIFIIERGGEEILSMETNDAIEVLLRNCEDAYGFPPYEDLKEFLYLRNGEDLREKEHAIIHRALSELPATVFRSNSLDWWQKIPAFANKKLANDIARAVNITPLSKSSREMVEA